MIKCIEKYFKIKGRRPTPISFSVSNKNKGRGVGIFVIQIVIIILCTYIKMRTIMVQWLARSFTTSINTDKHKNNLITLNMTITSDQ